MESNEIAVGLGKGDNTVSVHMNTHGSKLIKGTNQFLYSSSSENPSLSNIAHNPWCRTEIHSLLSWLKMYFNFTYKRKQ